MRNWCTNYLIIRVDNDNNQHILDTFVNNNKGVLSEEDSAQTDPEVLPEDLSFERSVPLGVCDYNNAIEKWGCKWDASDVYLTYEEGHSEANYYFTTPWEPPIEWIKEVGKKYPDLSFELRSEEQGCDFVVEFEIIGGELVKEKCYELTTYYFEKNGYKDLFVKFIRLLIENNIDYIQTIRINEGSFSLMDFMDDDDVYKSPELLEISDEVNEYENAWVFEIFVDNFINDKLTLMIKRMDKFGIKLKYRKIIHKNKFGGTRDLLEKVAYLPCQQCDTENEYFIKGKVPEVFKDGGVIFKDILQSIDNL